LTNNEVLSLAINSTGDVFAGTNGGGVFRSVPTTLLGDLNLDGILTSSDVVLELNCVFLGNGYCTLAYSDVNCDGVLTSSDVVLLLNAVYLNQSFPCP